MIKRIVLMVAVLMALVTAQAAQVGQWTTYLPYWDITDIEPGQNKIFVLASKNLYAYNTKDNSVEAIDKTNMLNDTDIDFIAWCNDAKRLVIVYSNYNIDLLDEQGNVTNMSQYYYKGMTYSKNIRNISVNGIYAYLTTDFGILKIDVKNAAINNTYILDDEIDDAVSMNGYIYAIAHTIKDSNNAITRMGYIIKGKESENLLNKNNWEKTLEEHTFNRIFNVNGQLMTASAFYIVKYMNLPDREFQPIYIHGSYPNIMESFCCNNGKLIANTPVSSIICDNENVQEVNRENITVMAYSASSSATNSTPQAAATAKARTYTEEVAFSVGMEKNGRCSKKNSTSTTTLNTTMQTDWPWTLATRTTSWWQHTRACTNFRTEPLSNSTTLTTVRSRTSIATTRITTPSYMHYCTKRMATSGYSTTVAHDN